jgi:hypothetical protein
MDEIFPGPDMFQFSIAAPASRTSCKRYTLILFGYGSSTHALFSAFFSFVFLFPVAGCSELYLIPAVGRSYFSTWTEMLLFM